jgi:predicted alpha/beta hydrolase
MNAWLHFGTGNEPRQTINVDVIEAPLGFHKRGLSYTATGYGNRIPTAYMVKWQGKWRRVYAACYGNAASTYIGKANAWLATVDVER